jgi:hypothetical protein
MKIFPMTLLPDQSHPIPDSLMGEANWLLIKKFDSASKISENDSRH